MPSDRRFLPGLLLAILLLGACGAEEGRPVAAPDAGPPAPALPRIPWDPVTVVAARAVPAPTIDGRLDEAVWQGAPPSPPFVDIRGGDAPPPRFETRVRLLWDDEALYVGAEMEEPHLQSSLTERDAHIWQEDNDFEVFLDPDHDTHDYVELEVNAFGTEWDLLLDKPYRDGGRARDDFDLVGLETAVHLDGTVNDPRDVDQGWSVELRIPHSALAEVAGVRVPPRPGDVWRVNFSRVEWPFRVEGDRYVKSAPLPPDPDAHPEDNWVFSPQGLVAMHYPERWGLLGFSADPVVSPGARVEVRDEDRARDALRRVYHVARRTMARDGTYDALARSTFLSRPPGGFSWPPEVVLRPGGYEASVALPDGRRLLLREDGWVGWAPGGEGR